jgi:hypothetical protein
LFTFSVVFACLAASRGELKLFRVINRSTAGKTSRKNFQPKKNTFFIHAMGSKGADDVKSGSAKFPRSIN